MESFFIKTCTDSNNSGTFVQKYGFYQHRYPNIHSMKSKKHSAELFFLMILVAVAAVCGLFGGYHIMTDPQGESLKVPLESLEGSISFPMYKLPGLVMFLALGIFPLFLVYPLVARPSWHFWNSMNLFSSYHWSWTFSIYTAIMILLWTNLRIIFMNAGSDLDGFYGLLGVTILIVALLPQVKRRYRLHSHRHQQRVRHRSHRESRHESIESK
jgi:hypothetical protein